MPDPDPTPAPTPITIGHTAIGSCSLCGGPVTIPSVWHCIIPPVATCARCGATKADDSAPVIPMAPPFRPCGVATRTATHTGDTSYA